MQETINYTLSFLSQSFIDPILKIADQQLGNGFLNREFLSSYINNNERYCQLALDGETVVGFSLMEIGNCTEIASKFKSGSYWFLEYFSAYEQIGYRSLTAVSADFEGRGIASLLVEKGLELLSGKVEVVVCDAWKSETNFIGNILERNGYEPVREIPFYWNSDSIKTGYSCKACGNPCSCTAVIYAKFFTNKNKWWEREDLKYRNGILEFSGKLLLNYIETKQTPLYIYNTDRIIYKYNQLCTALDNQGVPFLIYYAMKANRHPAILNHLKIRTNCGIDVCSPNELDLAIQYGFSPDQISYTGTSISDNDLKKICVHNKIRINLDSLSAVRRFAKFSEQKEIGIRINTGIGMAYNQGLEYAGNKVVKFGIYRTEWEELKKNIDDSDLVVDTVHCHAGSGFLSDQLPRLAEIFKEISFFIELFPTVKTLNLGGGLGVPQQEGDQPLDLEAWSAIISTYVKNKGLNLSIEPGDYLVKDSGILVTQVNSVEIKKGKLFVGIDAGMNMNNEYAYYDMNLEAIPLKKPINRKNVAMTLCGNINEPIDLFAEDKEMPLLEEGEYIALLNSGGYGASSSSNHCMRGDFKEYIICK
jgi:diaminopimelate decarboxylase